MTDNTPQKDAIDVQVVWVEHPTLLVDQIIGFANVDNVPRVAFGQLNFAPGKGIPVGKPVVTLAATLDAWRRIRDQINTMLEDSEHRGVGVMEPEATN